MEKKRIFIFSIASVMLLVGVVSCTTPPPVEPQPTPVPVPAPAEEETKPTSTTEDVVWLARMIASEAGSVWDNNQWIRCTAEERSAVGWTALNRLASGRFGQTIEEVVSDPGQYACNQEPTAEIIVLARKLLEGSIPDPTGGATNFLSPIGMPKEGEPTTGFDVGGGLHEVPGVDRLVYFPSWTQSYKWVGDINNVRRAYFMFYQSPENGQEVTASTINGWSPAINISHPPYVRTSARIPGEGKDFSVDMPVLAVDNSGAVHAVWLEIQSKFLEGSVELELREQDYVRNYYILYASCKGAVWSEPMCVFSLSEIGSFLGPIVEMPDGPYFRQKLVRDLTFVVDKNDNLHVTWRLIEGQCGPVLNEGSAPTTYALEPPFETKIFYCCKPHGQNWSDPFVVAEDRYGDPDKPSIAKLAGDRVFQNATVDNKPLLIADAQGAIHLLVKLTNVGHQTPETACKLGVYCLHLDENGNWRSEQFPNLFDHWNAWFWVIADAQGTWHFLWMPYEGQKRLMYAKRQEGQAWSKPKEIAAGDFLPRVSMNVGVDSIGNLHITWCKASGSDAYGGPPFSVAYAVMQKGGKLSAPVYLTRSSGTGEDVRALRIALDTDNKSHVIWWEVWPEKVVDQESNMPETAIMYSTNSKDAAWSSSAIISNNVSDSILKDDFLRRFVNAGRVSDSSSIVVDKEAVHVVFSTGWLILHTFKLLRGADPS